MNKALPRTILLDEERPPAPSPGSEDTGFGFQDLLSVIFSQRIFMATIILVTMLAGGVFIYFQPPLYVAEAEVALGPGRGADLGKGAVGTEPTTPDTALIESEIEILKSNDLMNRLIDKITPQTAAQALVLRAPISFAAADVASIKRRDLVKELQRRLAVKRIATSNVISVGFSSYAPQTSVLLANTLIDVYLESKIDERLEASQRASDWLNRRVAELAKEVEQKEAAVASYRAEMKLLSVDGATLDEQQYFKLQGEVVAARADLAGKQARLAQIQQIAANGGSGDAVLEAVSSPTIQALRQKEADIAGREAELKQRYFDTHPAVQQVMHEHQQVAEQIAAEISRIKASQGNEVDVARSRLRELEAGLAQLEGTLVAGNRSIVRLKELQRDADASSAVYKDFMLRAREIAEQESLKVVDARSVSRAIAPKTPSSTSPKIWLAFFLAAGFFLALLGAIIRAALNDRIVRIESVQRRLGVPALVSVPLISRHQLRKLSPDERTPEDFLVIKPMTVFAESLRVLAANLLSDPDSGHDAGLAVAVTSAVAAEGKTTVSLSLGRSAAMSGLRVLIMDCDARRPSLSACVGDRQAVSLAEVIKNNVDWRTAAVPDLLTSAVILPINTAGTEVQTLFRPEAVRKVLAEVRSHFDLIVLDCPPVLAVAETRWVTSVADTTIVVTQWNKTRSSAVKTALREVFRTKGRVAGVVLNRMDIKVTRRFSFSDPLYYGAGGKGYYTN